MKEKVKFSRQLAGASGPMEDTLKNDMMFHMVMSRTRRGLKGLICALKGLKEEDVREVTILNPISYGDYLQKEIIVDTLVELNNNEILNIELQIEKDPDWIKRSLLYLCRAYDNIRGEDRDYDRLKPTTHIGILNHDLFPDHPEFYARYLLTNVENGNIYTTIFGMNVLSLNRTALATKEDKENRLDYWAEVFRAETWEDLRKLAEESETVAEVAEAMYQVNADESARSILRARRKFEEVYTTALNRQARAEAKAEAAEARFEEAEAKAEAAEAKAEAAETRFEEAEAKAEAAEAKAEAAETRLEEAENRFTAEIEVKDQEIESMHHKIDAMQQEIEQLRRQLETQ
ncbi:MAG: Rpn family recombination-promoting nuclease/putative transposase [Lachnospiraceae bacterium]|nr:Rpn family recombination-promoting nuclease/putative transposase [Lachnospiraceae bacterium]